MTMFHSTLSYTNSTKLSDNTFNDENNLLNVQTIILFFIFWNLIGIIIQAKLIFLTESKTLNNQIYDGCSNTSNCYKYMVRLKYGNFLNGYQSSNSTIMIDLLDNADHFITRFVIPPSWFTNKAFKLESKTYNNFKIIKFRLNRKTEFPEIGSARINHDVFTPNNSSIHIFNLQIKDLNKNKLINIPINKPIIALGPDSNFIEQMFKVNKPVPIDTDEDMFNEGIAPCVTITEFAMFVFILINLSTFITFFTRFFLSFDKHKPILFLVDITSSLISLIILVFLINFYQFYVKERFIFKIGSNKWRIVRILFVIICTNLSIFLNLIAFWILISDQFEKRFIAYFLLIQISLIFLFLIIYSINKFKINKISRLKPGSLTILGQDDLGIEKINLNVPLDLFKLPKDF